MARLMIGLLLTWAVSGVQAQEITLRHALDGKALDALTTLTARFNAAQKDKAKVSLQALKDLDDRGHLPVMALLDTDDSMSFFASRPRFKPLYQVMAESAEQFDGSRFYPVITDAVDDFSGRIQALPLGLSLPVLFWNKAAFRKAGLDPEVAPRTWAEVQQAAGALADAGYGCPLTSSRFAWVHLENLSAQHNEPLIAPLNRVTLNRLVDVKHIALLSSWYKSHYFRYYGPRQEADGHFLSGECAMLTGEASLYAQAVAGRFSVGMTVLPHYDDFYGALPHNVLPDGAGLWLLAGKKKDEYRVAARFASFMMEPQNQRDWVRATGYLPMTPVAAAALRQSGMPTPLVDAAMRRLTMATATARPKAGEALDRLRDIIDEEIEFVWRNEKPAKEALDTAMRRFEAEVLPGPAEH